MYVNNRSSYFIFTMRFKLAFNKDLSQLIPVKNRAFMEGTLLNNCAVYYFPDVTIS